ncbi:hypothetical protein JCM19239_3577 [Vibrio variabilis]|uniref:Uncharacterized protein n=1 Tax=Vibrio variabilis TaxID=990271 RepID=A0ABQ0JHT2_9VIBR|nr:hypothetical protein JCM19239_3577 [Vibrio variabilis]
MAKGLASLAEKATFSKLNGEMIGPMLSAVKHHKSVSLRLSYLVTLGHLLLLALILIQVPYQQIFKRFGHH